VSKITAEAARTGEAGLRVGKDEYFAGGASVHSAQFAVEPGQMVRMSFWARAKQANLGVYFMFFDEAGKMVGSPPICAVNKADGQWHQYGREAVAPERAKTVDLWVHTYAGAKGIADLDDFSIGGLGDDAKALPAKQPKSTASRKVEQTPEPDQIPKRKTPAIIVLKLDDVKQVGKTVHPRWQRMADYLEKRKIKSGFGVICQTLETASPEYVQWITSRRDRGLIEFWFHGWDHAVHEEGGVKYNEFKHRSYEQQSERLARSQKLAKQKLGFAFETFGPPGGVGNGSHDQATLRVMVDDADLHVMLYPQPLDAAGREAIERAGGKFVILDRVWAVGLEGAVGVPNFARFLRGYAANPDRAYFTLQGHPAMWDDARFAEFEKIVDFLVERKAVFMTPTEAAAAVRREIAN
jgi:peptidoglycan/xylan/chitin deacetylase (PgdA/CDA1 family)